PERLADLEHAERLLLLLRLEEAFERVADVLDGVVDDRVEADVDLLALGDLADAGHRADLEAEDDRVRGGGEHHVRLGDRADAGVDDVHGDLLVRDLQQRVRDGLDGAGHVALDDEVEVGQLAEGHAAADVVERDVLALAHRLLALDLLPLLGDLPRLALVLEHDEAVPDLGSPAEAEDLDGPRRACRLHALVALVEHGADAPGVRPGHERVADLERAVLDEDRDDDAAPLVEPALDDGADGEAVGVGLELEELGLDEDFFEELGDALAGLGRDELALYLPAVLLDEHVLVGELL